MSRFRQRGLLIQTLVGQTVIVLVTGLILIGTAILLAPAIFNKHLEEAGITSESARLHVSEAFSTAISISLSVAAIASVVISGAIGWYFMLRIVRPIEEMAEFASALAAGKSDIPSVFSVSNSELDQLAEALTEMSRDLALSREEQSRMLSDLAHELRTPIATIGALVDGIEDGVVEGDAKAWETIRHQLERLNRLSRDVRNVSDNSDQVLGSIPVTQSALDICSTAFMAWKQRFENAKVHLSLNAQENLPAVQVDSHRIGQVLSNLLENALRHTPAGGKVEIQLLADDERIKINVIDNGEGIEPEHIPHIFERLYRGDASRASGDSGSGLGLTIARSIASSHGGTLTAESAGKGKGSAFSLSLPVDQSF